MADTNIQQNEATDFPVIAKLNGNVENISPGGWVRKLEEMEEMFAICGYLKTMFTSQALYVSSEEPLTKDILDTALQHLVKTFPILNVCVQRRGAELWFRRMQETVIDFEVMEDDPETAFSKVLGMSYNMKKGPLWAVRMVTLSPQQPSPRGTTATNHTMIILGAQHVMNDSTTYLVILNELVKVLNSLFKGQEIIIDPYPINPPTSEFFDPVKLSDLAKFKLKMLWNCLSREVTRSFTFGGLFPSAPRKHVETKFHSHVFTEEVSKSLLANCKENKVSVNSCLVAAGNISWFLMLQKKSKRPLDKTTIHTYVPMDLRRFYPKQEKEYLGLHIGQIHRTCTVTPDAKQNFWGLAQEEQKTIYKYIEEKGFRCDSCSPILSSAAYVGSTIACKCKIKPVQYIHHVFTNAGNVTKYFNDGNTENPVQVTDYLRSAPLRATAQFFTLAGHSLNNRLYISMDQMRYAISDENAMEYFAIFKDVLTSLAVNNCLPE